jgi:hypothetical protein
MAPTICRSFALAIFLSLTLAAFNAQGQDDDQHPTAVEIAQLPRFCWQGFRVPNAVGPEFHIPLPSDCGWGMNHYCLGLVDLIRMKKATNKRGRLGWLGLADANVRYTENAMKDYPNCSLREHVAASRAEINKFMLIYGGRRPKPQ